MHCCVCPQSLELCCHGRPQLRLNRYWSPGNTLHHLTVFVQPSIYEGKQHDQIVVMCVFGSTLAVTGVQAVAPCPRSETVTPACVREVAYCRV